MAFLDAVGGPNTSRQLSVTYWVFSNARGFFTDATCAASAGAATLEASVRAANDLACEREALERQWQHRLERARYEAKRRRRQYDAVEPENRLVARTLERQWEQSLAEQTRSMRGSSASSRRL
jgi:hypothetical protein